MNELTMTVSGWVATDPKFIVGAQGARMTTFRLASTSRYFDRDKGEWVDGRTEWFTVRVFRSAAELVNASIAKGQPVVVTGRFRSSTWESDAGSRTDLVLDATAVGHDLTRGVATFERASGSAKLPPEAYPRGVTPASAPRDAGAEEGFEAPMILDEVSLDAEAEADAEVEEAGVVDGQVVIDGQVEGGEDAELALDAA